MYVFTRTPFQVCTGIYCKRLYDNQLGAARFVCDHYNLNAPCAVGLCLPFPLFHVVPVLSSSIRCTYSGCVKQKRSSLVPPPGEDIRLENPLLGQRSAHKNEGWRLQVYLSLQKDRDNLVKSVLKHTKLTFWTTKSSNSTPVHILTVGKSVVRGKCASSLSLLCGKVCPQSASGFLNVRTCHASCTIKTLVCTIMRLRTKVLCTSENTCTLTFSKRYRVVGAYTYVHTMD